MKQGMVECGHCGYYNLIQDPKPAGPGNHPRTIPCKGSGCTAEVRVEEAHDRIALRRMKKRGITPALMEEQTMATESLQAQKAKHTQRIQRDDIARMRSVGGPSNQTRRPGIARNR